MTNAYRGRLGLYIADGSVSCAQAAQVMSQAFSNAPSTTIATGESLYADGWVCGGQMGGYSCSWPYLQVEADDPQKEVIALSCSNPGCPDSTTAQRTSMLRCSAGTPEGDGEYSNGTVTWVRGMTCEAVLALIEPHRSELVGKRTGTTYVLDGFRCKVVYPGGPDVVDECTAGSRVPLSHLRGDSLQIPVIGLLSSDYPYRTVFSIERGSACDPKKSASFRPLDGSAVC